MLYCPYCHSTDLRVSHTKLDTTYLFSPSSLSDQKGMYWYCKFCRDWIYHPVFVTGGGSRNRMSEVPSEGGEKHDRR